jgi:hypothetical protein
MRPDELTDRLERRLDRLEADLHSSSSRPLDLFWRCIIDASGDLPIGTTTIAPGWFQGVVSIGPFVETPPWSLEDYRSDIRELDKWLAHFQAVADAAAADFVHGHKPLPAYGGETAPLIYLRQHGHPDSKNREPVGYMWTCGRGATHLDQDTNRLVHTPTTVFWLREASDLRHHRDELYFSSVADMARSVFAGFSRWHSCAFGPG